MGKGNTNTTTSATTSSADPQAAAAYRDLLTRATGVADTPYQAYSGELVAPTNSQQNLGISGINSNANYAQPYIGQAATYANSAAQPISAGQIANYQNPYTQSVVDATQAQFNNQNQQAQQGLTSNAIAQGALGGNRVGVASANLANQQQLAQAPTIAGLYNNSYQQALTAAQGDAARQQAAAYSLGNLGVAGQSAALSGAGAQLGAGTLQQQTQQAQDTAGYGQYTQAQAYPFQTTQWLAGLQTGVGSNLGGSSTGQTTAPAPNQTAQYLGLGLSAAAMLSDERAKEDIEHIGKMNDGQNIYRYRYKGSPEWHIGPMAQEVEDRHPEHVGEGVSGLKYIDLKGATDDSVRSRGGGVRHFDSGGGVSGTPWSEGVGWVPNMSIKSGSGAPHASAPSAPSQSAGVVDPNKIISQAMGLAGKFGGGDSTMGSPGVGSPMSVIGGAGDYAVPTFMARGGGVGHFAGGGAPSFMTDKGVLSSDYQNGDPAWDMPPQNDPTFNVPGSAPQRFADVDDEVTKGLQNGTLDALASNYSDFKPKATIGDGGVPLPQARPAEAPGVAGPAMAKNDDDEDATPAAAKPTAGVGMQPSMRIADDSTGTQAMGFAPEQPREDQRGLFFKMSPAAQAGLLGAGLGMLSSRSPNLGNAIGDGGTAGFATYAGVKKGEMDAEKEASKLARDAKKTADDLALRTRQVSETERHNKAGEEAPPKGYELTKDGQLRAIKGGPADPEAAGALANAKKPKGELMDDDTAQLLADRVRAGDTRALIGLGRGAQGAENIAKIQGIVARDARNGKEVDPAARSILSNAANHAGLLTAERTQAAIMAKLSVYGRTAFNATDIAEKASDAVPRSEYQPINKVLNAARTNTGDPKIVALGQALMTLTNEYARAIGGGHGTVHDKQAAEARLSAAQSPEQLRAVINVIRQEIVAAEHALPAARQQIRDVYNTSGAPKGTGVAGGHASPAAQPAEVIQNGYRYRKGPDGQYQAVGPVQ